VRLRILGGRRTRQEKRLRALEESIERTSAQMDLYAERLQRHGIEGAEREVSWLQELIDSERGSRVERKQARAVKKETRRATKRVAKRTSTGRKKA